MNSAVKPIIEQLNQILLGKDIQIQLALCCLLADGHLLIEDVPGVGKTTLAKGLADSLGLAHQRVQFTSDMLPADLIGVSIFDQSSQQFAFHQGPVFSQLLLGDEINRASPKTQSALLEAMAEKQVSVDGKTYPLPTPFFVIATQNSMEHAGTFELPDSQLDRFLMRVTLGYPSFESEKNMLTQTALTNDVIAILDVPSLLNLQQQVKEVSASDAVVEYILRLVNETRINNDYVQALSPRATRAMLSASKGWAFIQGRNYVLPEDVQAILPSVCEHRLRNSQSKHNKLSDQLLHSINPLV